MSASDSTNSKLAEALAECERLREENRRLRGRLEIPQAEPTAPFTFAQAGSKTHRAVTAKSSPDEKVKLFRSLFRGREDVYAVRWEGRNGKTGYSPAHRRVLGIHAQKNSKQPREYFPLTDL